MENTSAEQGQAFVFQAMLDIASIGECFEKLTLYLKDHQEPKLNLDASAVEKVDGAGLQLLVALSLSLNKLSQQQLQWVAASDELKQAATLLGLAQQLNLEESAS